MWWGISLFLFRLPGHLVQIMYEETVGRFVYEPIPTWFSWSRDPEALIVFLHGVNQSKHVWRLKVLKMLDKLGFFPYPAQFRYSVFAPWYDLASTSMADNCEVFEDAIRRWSADNPGKPIILVGFSAGGRAAARLESRLPENLVTRVITVGSPLGRHGIMDYAPVLLGRFFVGKLFDELAEPVTVSNVGKYETFSGDLDEKVWPASVTALVGAPQTRLVGYHHEMLMRAPEVFERLNQIVKYHGYKAE